MNKIKLGIVGYGNLGKGIEKNIQHNPDMEIVAVFTRRDPKSIQSAYPVFSMDDMLGFVGKIDVMMLCGGSANDLPVHAPQVLQNFCTVDSFDTHARIPEYFDKMESVGKANGTLGAISIGWDPGLFSTARAMFASFLPSGTEYTFWGKGVSQGHSDAIRNVKGVKKGLQYTIPKDAALESVRAGNNPILSAKDKHLRECFVVAESSADCELIKSQIVNMPNYFADYDTVVHFISDAEFDSNHTAIPHGGFVCRSGNCGDTKHLLELSIKLESNPLFTSSILLSYARAVTRLYSEGRRGAVTVLDVPIGYLPMASMAELRKNLL